jgi:hypothetical protein
MRARAKLVAIALVIGVVHCAEFTEQEFECELAVTRLQECCPAPPIDWEFCRFESSGCGHVDTYPAYTIEESRCVQHASCASIVDAGLCETPEELGSCS